MDNVLFVNETNVEKVITFGEQNSTTFKSSKATKFLFGFILSAGLASLILIPWKHTFIAIIFAVIVIVASCGMYIKATATKKNSDVPPIIRTGESNLYRYEFTESGIRVSGETEKNITWKDIISVRNIGVAYQIKCTDSNFTVKKSGFKEGGVKQFIALMERNNIEIN